MHLTFLYGSCSKRYELLITCKKITKKNGQPSFKANIAPATVCTIKINIVLFMIGPSAVAVAAREQWTRVLCFPYVFYSKAAAAGRFDWLLFF
jgi:hypothetical protein